MLVETETFTPASRSSLMRVTPRQVRGAGERPLTLAIVGNDASVPQALQAGANSILRKPIQAAQARETLTTAKAAPVQ